MRHNYLIVALACTVLASCSGKQTYRSDCKGTIDNAWAELDIMASDGFAGSVSYTKALSLLTSAKTMQTIENYDNCVEQAQKARYYMEQARQGQ